MALKDRVANGDWETSVGKEPHVRVEKHDQGDKFKVRRSSSKIMMGSTGAPPVVFRAPAEDSASGYDGGVHLSETGGGGASRGARRRARSPAIRVTGSKTAFGPGEMTGVLAAEVGRARCLSAPVIPR